MKKRTMTAILTTLAAAVLLTAMLMVIAVPSHVIKKDRVIVEGLFSSRVEIPFSSIKAVEILDDPERGTKVTGIASILASSGVYRVDEVDYYLFAYEKVRPLIAIRTEDASILFNCSTEEKTLKAFSDLKSAVLLP